MEVYPFRRCLGERFLPLSTFFSLVSSRAFRDAPHSRFRCGDVNQCLLNFLKMLLSALPKSEHVYFTCGSLSLRCLKDSRPFISFFHLRVFARLAMRHTRVFGVRIPSYSYGALHNVNFGPEPNLYKRISLVEVYRFGQCLGWRLSPISTFFSLVSSRAFRDAPHSRFRRGDPNQCLRNFSKMLLLALPEIYTCVFYLWKSIDLDNAGVRDFRLYQLSFR